MNLYEEKYNEILEWARKNKARLNGVPIEEVLPELRESEDERIINQLITLVNSAGEFLLIPTYKEELVAWLEKQKEQKPWKVGANAYFTPEQKPADLSDMMVHKEPYIAPVPTPMVADEQKPEWSEEDEKMLERAIHIIVEYSDIDEEESEIVQNWLKSLRPSWKPSEEQMKALQNAVALTACDKELVRLYNQLKKL